MVVTIELKPDVEAVLTERAASKGCDLHDYVQGLIERDARSPRTFDEILAPLRWEVAQSGVTDEELGQLFTKARREVFRAKRRRAKK
jgi:hypothetical protein